MKADWDRIMLYSEEPEHEGKIPDGFLVASHKPDGCGDRVRFGVLLEDGIIKRVVFEHEGCMFSKAVAEFISSLLEGSAPRKIDVESIIEEFGRSALSRPGCVEASLVAANNVIDLLSQTS